MSDVHSTEPSEDPGSLIRAYRVREDISLDVLADRIHETGCKRPSTAKLSRIETGVQPVSLDILDALVVVTKIPPQKLSPDVAAKFASQPEPAQ